MSEIMLPFAEPQSEAEYEAAFQRLLAELERLNRQMRDDQTEIERLQIESAAYKTQSQRLKAEGKRLNADIRARLDTLRTTLDCIGGTA